MTEDKFINAMNTLDDDLLIEAMAETPAIISSGARRSRLGRRQMVAIVAAVLIFVLAAGFASGIFTAPIRFFNANEVWGSTSKAIAFGKEVNMLGLQTQGADQGRCKKAHQGRKGERRAALVFS